MAMTLPTILLIIALICFIIAAVGAVVGRVNFTAAGLAFLTASMLTAGGMLG